MGTELSILTEKDVPMIQTFQMAMITKRLHPLMSFIYCFILASSLHPSIMYGKAKQTTLEILVWEGYAPENFVRSFKEQLLKEHQIDAMVRVKYAEEYSDFFDNIRSGQADIISIPSNMVRSKKFGFIEKKLIVPLRLKNIPNYDDILSSILNGNYATEAGKTYGVPIAHGPYGLAYNTKLVNPPPSSWNDLWDKKYINNYVISSDQFEANIYITALASGMSREDMSTFSKVYSKKFEKRLTELAKNSRNQWVGVDSPEDLKGAALATSWGDSFHSLKKLGEDWKFAEPKEGTTGWLDYILITKNAMESEEKRLAAESWLNFIISPDFQIHHIVRELGNDPVNYKIREQLTPEEIAKHHLTDLDYFRKKRILWPVLEVRDHNGFENLWKSALNQISTAAKKN